MLKCINNDLPEVVKDFLEAHIEKDHDKFMASFVSDALVNDVQREFYGLDQIRAWANKEIFGAAVTVKVEQAYEQYGSIILRGVIDGNFDKRTLPDPLILTYYFNIKNEKITQLIVLRNKSVAV